MSNALPNQASPQQNDRKDRLIAMGQMAASLAHEIRNPLGSMELFCSLLKKDLRNEPDTLRLAEHVYQGIRTLDRIITNCLQFSKEINPKLQRIDDISGIIEEAFRYVEARAAEHRVRLEAVFCGEGVVYIDPYQFNQALLNVLINAIDAVAECKDESNASPRLVQVFSELKSSGEWQLRISDNGGGIPEEHQEMMFDPFFTTKDKGTGLGLAIVHSIISAHQGTVCIESEVSRGTSVLLTFPRAR